MISVKSRYRLSKSSSSPSLKESKNTSCTVSSPCHCTGESSIATAVVYVRNKTGVEWETLDDTLVTDIFALAIPQDGSDEHLDNLIAISTSLMDEEICERLRAAGNEEEVREIFQ